MARHPERVDVGKQMTADAVGVYHLQHVRLLFSLLSKTIAAEQRRVEILRPTQRREVYLQVIKDLVVESVLPDKKFVNACKEQPALGTLNDAVIICAGQREDLADTERRERSR